MQIVIVGTHQRICPVAVRERLAFSPERLGDALAALRGYTEEGFIISTCNRVEVGGIVASEADLARFLCDWHQMAPEALAPHLYTFVGDEAVRHLFRLAAGLDSMVLGEDQVMGQIKAGLSAAQAAGAAGPRVNRLMRSALAAGKLARTDTEIARSHLSTVSVALEIARDALGGLRGRRVVVVGAGKMAGLALKHLRGDQPQSVALLNRTLERAQALAEPYRAQALPFDCLEAAIAQADVVLSTTAAQDTIISAAMVERTLAGRDTALILLDLAVPRDIDPRAAELPGVKLVGIDDMKAICEANWAARAAEVAKAEALVQGEVAKFMEWWAAQAVVPTIRALRERAEAIRQAEIERTLAKLAHLSERDQQAILAMSAAIVNKLLHPPITALKEPGAGEGLAQMVQQLFQLDEISELEVKS